MKGPFPGMDPYLERRWGGFHTRFVTYLSDVINPALPRALRARVEERVVVEASEASEAGEDAAGGSYWPDAHIYEKPGALDFKHEREGGGTATLAEPVAEPVVLHAALEVGFTQRSLIVVDARSGGEVISAIEMLSPPNKRPGRGHAEYLGKQSDSLDGGVNLLELDLLLQDDATTVAALQGIPPRHHATYHASLTNARMNGRVELYPLSLRQRLPRIALPLRDGDTPIVLDLQRVFDTAYERGYYAEDVNYEAVSPALSQDEKCFAAECITRWEGAKGAGV